MAVVQKKQMAVVEESAPLKIVETRTTDFFDKCRMFTTAKDVMAAGLYPYFHVVESEQSPEVIVDGFASAVESVLTVRR